MTWWRRLVGGSSGRPSRPTDFLSEALDLEASGDVTNALTSYRLAIRQNPNDLDALQNIAILFSRTRQPEEAMRAYRRVLEVDPNNAAGHYGLAFLLLKRNDTLHAGKHLEAFLRNSTEGDENTMRFRAHAEKTLRKLRGDVTEPGDERIQPTNDGTDSMNDDRIDEGDSSTSRPSGH